MKKLISVLTLIVLLPVSALAAPDFIGTWYFMTDSRPIGSDVWMLMEFAMYSDGTCALVYEGTVEELKNMAHYYAGTWQWDEENSIVYFIDSAGMNYPMYYSDGNMYMETNGFYIKLNKLVPLTQADYVLNLPD